MSEGIDGPFRVRVAAPGDIASARVLTPADPSVIKVVTQGPIGPLGPPGDLSDTSIRRVAAPGAASISASDRLVLLAGPAQAILPAAGQGIVQITLKDAGSVEQNGPVLITTEDGAAIDGQPSLTFVNPGQAATLTFVAGAGWIIT